MKNDKLIIFDCDGVLVDSEDIANTTFAKIVRGLEIALSDEEAIHHFPGSNLQSCVEYVEHKFETKLPDTVMDTYREESAKAFAEHLQPIPGIHKVLKNLSCQRCVASNGPHEKIVDNLAITGLDHFFEDHLFSAYTINKWKPDPALFLWVADSMNFVPSDCIVVEDSLHGVIAAKNAGIKTFAYLNKNRHQADLIRQNGAQVFEDMEELLSLIN